MAFFYFFSRKIKHKEFLMQELISIENENSILINGATKVVSSIPTQAVIETKLSMIVIAGNELEVKKLDIENDKVVLSGKILGIKFNNPLNKQSFLKRIFK